MKLQPVPPSMPLEAPSVRISDIHSASSGIDGGTGCNCIFSPITIVSSNRVMSIILVQIGENYEVNIRHAVMCHANLAKMSEIPKNVTKQLRLGEFLDLTVLKFLLCHRHFHYDDVIIIILYVFSINSIICHYFKVFLYMLYILSYCTDNPFHRKNDVTIRLSPITPNLYER